MQVLIVYAGNGATPSLTTALYIPLTLIYCKFILCHVLALVFTGQITYSCLSTCFDVGSGSSVDHACGGAGHACGGVGGVLASFTTRAKECCSSSFLILPPLSHLMSYFVVVQCIRVKYFIQAMCSSIQMKPTDPSNV